MTTEHDIDRLRAEIVARATMKSIPTVDPEDLKKLWNFETGLEETDEAHKEEFQRRVFSSDVFDRVVDQWPVTFRKSQLFFAKKCAEAGLVDLPYFSRGKLDDAVFKAFATVPMTGMHKGMESPLTFDLEELTRIIQNEPEG